MVLKRAKYYAKYLITFGLLGIFTTAVVTSQIYLLLVNERYTFYVSIALFLMSLIYAFIVWISVNDLPFQGMCGFIAACLFLAGASDSLITPEWHLTAHFINKYAVFVTNYIASYSALTFIWARIVSLICGPPSRAMPITEKHEGFVYVCFNMFVAAGLAWISTLIDEETLYAYRIAILNRAWMFVIIGAGANVLLGWMIAYKRARYQEAPANKEGIVVDIM